MQEEEFLINTLQHKLSKVLAEKVEIENRLEQEQEYISNRLQKQVADRQREKEEMERRLEEQKMLVAQMMHEKEKLAEQLQHLRLTVEIEEESISNKLGKAVAQTKGEKDELLAQLERERAAAKVPSSRCHRLAYFRLVRPPPCGRARWRCGRRMREWGGRSVKPGAEAIGWRQALAREHEAQRADLKQLQVARRSRTLVRSSAGG